MQAEPYLDAEPVFHEQLRAIVRSATIGSDPPGATISYRPLRASERSLETDRPDADRRRPDSARHASVEGGAGRIRGGRGRRPGSVLAAAIHIPPRQGRADAAGHGPRHVVGSAVPDLHSRARSSAAGQARRLLDRSARGHEPRVQAVRRRWRLSPRGALAGAVHQGRQADRGRRGDGDVHRLHRTAGSGAVGAGKLIRPVWPIIR